ncbi:GAF domain-containing protein [Paenibacillus sp.]|uniref:GAF domain-containing protein n=1 Tax=Paenibacillus sp. TaxID=58172 RepID=UPI002D558009|nr:GAF domain-containing protein [Paenibacillus sp.]HZG55675.1 GAF domain-containing protein [Paenibacillus sp.]
MQTIIASLRHHRLTKETRRLLGMTGAINSQDADISNHLLRLYREELIGAEQYIYIETKLLLNRFCLAAERLFPARDVSMGVYFYDAPAKRLWSGGGPNVPPGYTEYANGLSAIPDIVLGDTPVYVNGVLPIDDVDSSEHVVALNHRRELLRSGISSFCAVPLTHEGNIIGHANLYSHRPKVWSPHEIMLIKHQARGIESKLLQAKARFIQAAAVM